MIIQSDAQYTRRSKTSRQLIDLARRYSNRNDYLILRLRRSKDEKCASFYKRLLDASDAKFIRQLKETVKQASGNKHYEPEQSKQ